MITLFIAQRLDWLGKWLKQKIQIDHNEVLYSGVVRGKLLGYFLHSRVAQKLHVNPLSFGFIFMVLWSLGYSFVCYSFNSIVSI